MQYRSHGVRSFFSDDGGGMEYVTLIVRLFICLYVCTIKSPVRIWIKNSRVDGVCTGNKLDFGYLRPGEGTRDPGPRVKLF